MTSPSVSAPYAPCVDLIMSGAFVSAELVAEFGLLPPSFLPLGTGRLYDMQVAALRQTQKVPTPIYLTIPENFEVPSHDRERLENMGVTLLSLPENLRLGEALVYVLNITNAYTVGLRLLHGDTIIPRIPDELDWIAAHEEGDDYAWATIHHHDRRIHRLENIQPTMEEEPARPVACGYFSFSSGAELVKAVTQARGDFIEGLNLYLQKRPLSLFRTEEWYDFGHLQTYFRSRRMVTTARSFNSLTITRNTVRKRSKDIFKMEAEARWLGDVPPSLQPYTARLLESGREGKTAFYTTEYQYAPNLAELYVFSSIGRTSWTKILRSSMEFLENCASIPLSRPRDAYAGHLMQGKTLHRLERFAHETGFDIARNLTYKNKPVPSLLQIAKTLEKMVSTDTAQPATVMHGDFCFSNILYNSRNDRISVIDPRGYVFDNEPEIYGDLRYDLAKFSHSVEGLYDFIIADRYKLKQENTYQFDLEFAPSPHRLWLQKAFGEVSVAGLKPNSQEIQAIMISLFLSMLPLHADRPDRQRAFIANALRLYSNLEG